jgi:hypothetical protein
MERINQNENEAIWITFPCFTPAGAGRFFNTVLTALLLKQSQHSQEIKIGNQNLVTGRFNALKQ